MSSDEEIVASGVKITFQKKFAVKRGRTWNLFVKGWQVNLFVTCSGQQRVNGMNAQ